MNTAHETAMRVALDHAKLASASGDVPVGAVVLHKNEIISARHNEREVLSDPTAHAEILALRDAAKALGDWRLIECTLVVTLEPCVMCAGAIQNSRIATLVFGVADPKGGATSSLYNICADPRLNHETKVIGPTNPHGYSEMLSGFFRQSGKRIDIR
jgi:tRNA(adenine34) deaminase